jgi:hypothetical protein
MAVYDQPKSTYSDTTPAIRVISETIRLIDPVDTPLLAALGGLDAARSKFNIKQSGTMIELLEDTYMPVVESPGITANIDSTTLTMTTTDGSLYQAGTVIMVEDEYMVIASVAAQIITVLSRTYGGTQATHTSTEGTISIVGMARLEGADASFVGLTDISAPYNYTSIFEKSLNVSGTDEAIDYYGMASPFAYQAKKSLPEQFRLIELALFHGTRAAGSSTTTRSFGGIPTFITANEIAAGGMISKADIDELSQAIFEDGGKHDVLVMNPEPAKDLHNLYDNSSFLRVAVDGGQLGRDPTTYVVTQFGTFKLLVDRWCPLSKAYAVDTGATGLYSLRSFGWKPLAVTGDSKKGELVGEFSFIIANAAGQGFISGIT